MIYLIPIKIRIPTVFVWKTIRPGIVKISIFFLSFLMMSSSVLASDDSPSSYLYCANSKDSSSDWAPAPPTSLTKKYGDVIKSYVAFNGHIYTVIYGMAHDSGAGNGLMVGLGLFRETEVGKIFANFEEAETFCNDLIRLCKTKTKPYDSIGAGGGQSVIGWNIIYVQYHENEKDTRDLACPNWRGNELLLLPLKPHANSDH